MKLSSGFLAVSGIFCLAAGVAVVYALNLPLSELLLLAAVLFVAGGFFLIQIGIIIAGRKP